MIYRMSLVRRLHPVSPCEVFGVEFECNLLHRKRTTLPLVSVREQHQKDKSTSGGLIQMPLVFF